MEGSGQKTTSPEVLRTAASLQLDLVTAELVRALREHDIRSIVLKGPSFARWLYSDGGFRPYGDSDLLVSPHDLGKAQEVLASLGFRYGYDSLGPGQGLPEGLGWRRGQMEVDLHCTLGGAEAEPALVWEVLSRMIEVQRIGGLDVEVLEAPARALHVALHAAKSGRLDAKPLNDLSRALRIASFDVWKSAAAAATRLDATAAFATGLRLLPEGAALAERLELGAGASTKTVLRAGTPPPLALGFEELAGTKGLSGKLRFLARKAFPSKVFMRTFYPLARRGRIGLVIAYCWRIIWLGLHIPAGLRAWVRARRKSR